MVEYAMFVAGYAFTPESLPDTNVDYDPLLNAYEDIDRRSAKARVALRTIWQCAAFSSDNQKKDERIYASLEKFTDFPSGVRDLVAQFLCYTQNVVPVNRKTQSIGLDYGVTCSISDKTYSDISQTNLESGDGFQNGREHLTLHQFRTLCQFRDKVNMGDLVVLRLGRKAVMGVGLVTSGYYFDHTLSPFRHRIAIKWLQLSDSPFHTFDRPVFSIRAFSKCENHNVALLIARCVSVNDLKVEACT
jgi:hypothetical protein